MATQKQISPLLQLLLGGAGFVIIIIGMQAAASIVNSFLLALIIAITVTPLLRWLIDKRVPKWLALSVTILVVVLTGLTFIAFLGVSVDKFRELLPTYKPRLIELEQGLTSFLASKNIDASDIFDLEIFSPESFIRAIAFLIAKLAEALSASLLILFIVAFMLIEALVFPLKLKRGLHSHSILLHKFAEFILSIRSYVWITTCTGSIEAIAYLFLLVLFGVKLAVFWSMLFFLLNFIPEIGFFLAVIPPVLLALLELGASQALLVFLSCYLIDTIADKVMKPRFMQQELDLSPLVIILSIIFWGWVLGATGVLVAVPLTLMIKKLVLESSENTRFLAMMLETSQTDSSLSARGIHPED
ncbi:MAG: AI-2E family transporter [Xenococcaceae cyanobacterium MO_167.B27]|nr:AI-2E family transporter [Xenococcaceae cyanobacterium MO_167.B27]